MTAAFAPNSDVIPAQAGLHLFNWIAGGAEMDSRLRGNDTADLLKVVASAKTAILAIDSPSDREPPDV